MAKKSQVVAEEQAVRDAAQALHDAVRAAEQAGYRVMWPANVGELPTISLSETARLDRTRTVTVSEEQLPAVEQMLSETSEKK